MNLYWVSTHDQHEDWFIISETKKRAELFHELMEGYAKGEATATMVMPIPESIKAREGWPCSQQLIDLGAIFLSFQESGTRIVEINGTIYKEGAMPSRHKKGDEKKKEQLKPDQSNGTSGD